MDIAKLVLEYIEVVFSLQMVIGVVALAFLIIFKEDIKALMLRVAKIRFPGGGVVTTSQAERISKETPTSDTASPVPHPERGPLPQNISLSPEDAQQIKQLLEAERANAGLWEYRYLNFFLVLNTQRVLDWLASLDTRPSYGIFNDLWMPIIPSAEERRAIINALETHQLIQLQGDLIEITPKGREYIKWRGSIPPPSS